MDAFLDWVNSNEPCTPLQAAAVIVAFAAVTIINLTISVMFTGRGQRQGNNEQTGE